jgi:TPR repeat protein
MFNLGVMYRSGRGVAQDDAQAAVWYRKAADEEHVDAMFNLGRMYSTGRGVARDDAQAAVWYREAAEQGHSSAQFNLGSMHLTGQGVVRDYVESYKWSNVAALGESGDAQREGLLGLEALATRMTPAQIAEAQRLVREWQAAFEQRQTE